MADAGLYIAGGLLTGLGAGMVEDGKAKREAALREMEDQRARGRIVLQDELGGKREASRDERTAKRQEEADERRFDRESGMLSGTIQDDKGNYYGVTKAGKNVPVGVKGLLPTSRTSEPLEEVYDEDSPTGSRLERRSTAAGKPSGKNASQRSAEKRDADDAIRREARKQAEKEAGERAGYFSSDATDFKDAGGSRSAWVERRTNEILAGRKGGGSGAAVEQQPKGGAPKGAGSRQDPYKAATQQDIDWFRQNAPAGSVLDVNGKLYSK